MDVLLILLAMALLAGIHSVLHGVLRPVARRVFPPRPAPATKTRLPAPGATDSRRRWDRFLLVLCALLLVGTFLQCFVL
ncbi:hypothetical protein [Silanimonas lenta]|jgi:hypothetical protein|uniref:hypothetical protein n=1 Tax=Silanimonas lenta TaxID=265429 RepID=UPI002FE13831